MNPHFISQATASPSVSPEQVLVWKQRQRIAVATADMVADAARHFINVVGGMDVIAVSYGEDQNGIRPHSQLVAYPKLSEGPDARCVEETLITVHPIYESVVLTYYGFSAPITFVGGYRKPITATKPVQYKPARNAGMDNIDASVKMAQLLSELQAQLHHPGCAPGTTITVAADPEFPGIIFRRFKTAVDLNFEHQDAGAEQSALCDALRGMSRGDNEEKYEEYKERLKSIEKRLCELDADRKRAWDCYSSGVSRE
jgi:hypothetical protein